MGLRIFAAAPSVGALPTWFAPVPKVAPFRHELPKNTARRNKRRCRSSLKQIMMSSRAEVTTASFAWLFHALLSTYVSDAHKGAENALVSLGAEHTFKGGGASDSTAKITTTKWDFQHSNQPCLTTRGSVLLLLVAISRCSSAAGSLWPYHTSSSTP